MDKMKVAVIAGTSVDTQMGVEFLTSKGINAFGYPASTCPREQSINQILSPIELEKIIYLLIKKIEQNNIDTIMIYCNSLSVAVDMDKLAIQENVKIVTPLHIYRKIACKYNDIGVITANNKSAAGIEKVIQSVNHDCNVIGIAILPIVVDIEKGIKAEEIIEKFALKNIMAFYNVMKVDVVILGCTHFPYLNTELTKYATIPILNPAELMYKMLCTK